MVKGTISGHRMPGFKPQFSHSLTWTTPSTFTCINFPPIEGGDDNEKHLQELFWELNLLIKVKHLKLCLVYIFLSIKNFSRPWHIFQKLSIMCYFLSFTHTNILITSYLLGIVLGIQNKKWMNKCHNLLNCIFQNVHAIIFS